MNVGFLQFKAEFKEKEKNLSKIEELLQDIQADLIVLPEMATTGYAFESKEELLPYCEAIPGYSTEKLTNLAKRKNMYIVCGIAEKESNNLYNSSVLVSPQGKLWKYRKVHLFYREKFIYESGNNHFEVIDIGIAKLGLLICFDWIYPEALRTLAIKGAQIICHSANLVLPFCQHAMQTRAIENRVFVITANRTGREQDYTFTGKSQIVSPESKVILKANGQEEIVKTVTINPKEADNKNVTEYNNIIKDRRTDLYFK